jgi:hypothetical protein
MCSGSGSAAATGGFLAERAKSILGSSLLCCSAICNFKILPNIMCTCGFAFRIFWIFIVASTLLGERTKTKLPTYRNCRRFDKNRKTEGAFLQRKIPFH